MRLIEMNLGLLMGRMLLRHISRFAELRRRHRLPWA
jgi:hypothetical protein